MQVEVRHPPGGVPNGDDDVGILTLKIKEQKSLADVDGNGLGREPLLKGKARYS